MNSSEVKGLLAVRSHDIPQCPMEHLTTHKRFNGITLEGDCLCSGEKQKRNEWEAGFSKGFILGGMGRKGVSGLEIYLVGYC